MIRGNPGSGWDTEDDQAEPQLPEPDFVDGRPGYGVGATVWGDAPRGDLDAVEDVLDSVLGRPGFITSQPWLGLPNDDYAIDYFYFNAWLAGSTNRINRYKNCRWLYDRVAGPGRDLVFVAEHELRVVPLKLGGVGARRVFLEVAEDNRAARGLYSAYGFAGVGRRAGYYGGTADTRADALILARDLDL